MAGNHRETDRHGLREQFSCTSSHCLVACELTYMCVSNKSVCVCEVLFKDTAVVNLDVSRAEVKCVVLPMLARVWHCVGSLRLGSSWHLVVLRVRQTL